MKTPPRTLLLTRLCAVLLLGLGTVAVGRLGALLVIDIGTWGDVWALRQSGPLGMAARLVTHWFEILTARETWMRSGPGLIAATVGVAVLLRTRWWLGVLPRWVLR